MVKYDKFELFMVKRMNYWAKQVEKENNRMEYNVFSELMWALYEYEKEKMDGDITAY